MTKARSNATANAAKGDLTVGSGTNLSSVLGVGSNGDTIVADNSTATGLRYQGNFAAGKNKIINGDFGVWQRSTSSAMTDGAYSAPDRYVGIWTAGGGTSTWSRQTFTPGTAPVAGYEGTFFSRTSATSGSASTLIGIAQKVEDVRTFAGQTATFSFWAKADSARTLTIYARQEFGSGGSGDTLIYLNTVSLTTSWTRYSVTGTVPSVSGKTIGTNSRSILYTYLDAGQASGTPVLDIWGYQWEAGSVATAFQTATGTIQGELAACQRYYYAHVSGAAKYICMAAAYSSSISNGYLQYPVTMRTTPTMAITTGTNYYLMYRNGTYQYFNTLAQDYASSTGTGATGTGLYITGLSQTAGWSGWFQSDNAASSIAFSAEL